MTKTFKVAQVRDLLNQVHNEKITFSRFVEILNEHADGKKKFNIQKLDSNKAWLNWLEGGPNRALEPNSLSDGVIDIYKKLHEVIDAVNDL